MQLTVPLTNTVRPRYRRTYEFSGATVTLRAQSATIHHPNSETCEFIKQWLIGQCLPDGIYVGSPRGTFRKFGGDD